MHRVLAADLVDEGRDAEAVFYPAHDVQIRQSGFHHDHVGSFGEIQRNFLQCLVAVGRVHLVAEFVAATETGSGSHGVAKRVVERRRIFGGIGEDAHVRVALLLQRIADRADAAVHHVRGRDHVGAGRRVGKRLLDQRVHGFVVGDIAVLIE